ncbi:MAG TPA: hemolysin family protein, partial [Lacipirellulaceae bacterium]|nr:hemolysin family protein [Lacipirellulaceae bacterium]
MIWEILLILVLILANGLFAAAEISFIAARKGRLEQRAEEGNRNARRALELARNPDLFLPIAQIGMTLVGALAAAYGGHQIVEEIAAIFAKSSWPVIAAHAEGLSLGLFVVCYTYATLIFGELVPKRASLHRAESLAIFLAPFVHVISVVARPFVWFLGISTSTVLWVLRLQARGEPTVSRDDIEHLIDTGTAEGVVEPLEQKLALGALRLGDRTVRDIMRPRIDLDAMDVGTPPTEVLGTVAMAGFSRLPVYEGDLDHVIGFVHIKDLFRQSYLGWAMELRKLLHPALFVPENLSLDRLLELFQEKHNQLAIVLNEYGGTEGMVTLEDVVEEIVGEMRDEHRRHEEQKFVERDDNTWLIDGAMSVADVIDRLNLSPDVSWEGRGFSTLAGLILDRLGHIPSVGDKTDWDELNLEVVD